MMADGWNDLEEVKENSKKTRLSELQMLYLSAFSVKLSFNQNNAVQSTVDWQFYNLIGKVKIY